MAYDLPSTGAVLSEPELDALLAPKPVKQFANEYGKVRTDRVIVPTGMPPSEWKVVV